MHLHLLACCKRHLYPAHMQVIALPESLRNNVAVLQAPNPTVPGGVTNVYLLGMSHVSQVRCYIRTAAVVPSVLCSQRSAHSTPATC
jgi:hypothetical protein